MTLDGLSFLEVTRRMPLMRLPVRTTIAELDGARVMLSPASTLGEGELRGAGEITDLVCPNLFHAGGMRRAAAVHPGARLWGPRGIRAKVPDLPWHGILGTDPWPHESGLAHVAIGGMPGVNESVFVHRRSGTLVVCDLAFNLVDARGLGAWLVLGAFGTRGRFAVSRLFTAGIRDRAAFEASVTALAALDFERVVPAHGAIVTSGGRERLLAALRERGYAPRPGPAPGGQAS